MSSSVQGFVANNPGDYITLTFTAAVTETNYDYWFINDAANGLGNTIATGDGNFAGNYLSITSEISFYIVSDGSITEPPIVYSLSCTPPPTCPSPSNLSASNITGTSADLSWTAGGTETAWDIQYGSSGFAPGSGTTVGVTTNPYSLTG